MLRADAALKPRLSDYGTHHPEGIFIAGGPGIRKGERLDPFSIIDITPTLLYSLGIAVPSDLEGQANLDVFQPDYVAAHPLATGAPSLRPQSADGESDAKEELSEEQEAEVMKRLQALGYME